MADLTYKQLQKTVSDLAQEVMANSGEVLRTAQQVNIEAQDTARVAELIGGMGVDTATIAETRELAKITAGVSQAAIEYTNAGATTHKTAKAAGDQARASHGGIHEAYNRASIDISRMKPEWLRQD